MSQQTIDAPKATSETHHASHERRVGHESQVVIGGITFFAATVAMRLSTGFDTSSAVFIPCILAALFGMCCTLTTYLRTSACSNKRDLEKARAADRDILDYLNQHCCPAIKKCLDASRADKPNPSQNRWMWQVAMIWGGGLISAVLVVCGK
jgi:hypothetical protein